MKLMNTMIIDFYSTFTDLYQLLHDTDDVVDIGESEKGGR